MSQPNRRTFVAASTAGILTAGTVLAAPPENAGPVRVGQIGTKHAHAAGKAATLRRYRGLFELVGIAESDARQRESVQNDPSYSGLKWMSEQELLATPGLEAVIVETHVDRLLDTAERCVEAGVHIHLDKPAGTSLSHFRRICEKADAAGLSLQMGYMFRSNPAFRFLFNAVCKGWLGDVFHLHAEMSKKVDDQRRPELGRYRGGSMFELGCHVIDAALMVLGPPDRVTPFNRNTRPELDQLMDTCLAVLEYPRATATIRSSLTEVDGFRRRQFVVCGTRGTITIQPLEPFALSLTLETATEDYKAGTHSIELAPAAGRYDGDLRHFAAVIRGREKPEYTTAHDLAVQKTVLQASNMPYKD